MTFDSATVYEAAGRAVALPHWLKALDPSMQIAAAAFTVDTEAGDNIWLHRAIYAARAGSVLIVATAAESDVAYWGEVMTHAAQQRGLVGLVVDGFIRDSKSVRALGFPTFCRGTSISRATKNRHASGALGGRIAIAGAAIETGDLVVGDADGVVVVPGALAAKAVQDASARQERERDFIAKIHRGASTLDLFGLR